MAGTLDNLRRGLDAFERRAFDGARDGLKAEAAQIKQEMRANHTHGNDTGATEAGYGARVVGRGETGAAAFAEELAAAEALNPGKTEATTVEVAGLGVILDSKTTYQRYLETENAGQYAELGPRISVSGPRLTRAAAEGSRKALS